MSKDTVNLKSELLNLLKRDAFKKQEVILSSGKRSSFYLDARCVTLSSRGAYLSASLILDILKDKDNIEAIGGPTLGADPLAGAIAAVSFLQKRPIKAFIVRKAPKPHGLRRQIEGPPLKDNSHLVVIDDVATSGKSLLESIDILRGEGFKIDTAICILDRQEGAEQALARTGCRLISLFTPKDLGIGLH